MQNRTANARASATASAASPLTPTTRGGNVSGTESSPYAEKEAEKELFEIPFNLLQQNRIYIRCQDANGNYNIEELVFEFCVAAGPDLTAPRIIRTSPQSGSGVAYNVNETIAEIFLNEPADCRWSKNDIVYEGMPNQFICDKSVANMQNDGTYKCLATLQGINSTLEKFYFRCKDQPFANESDRNANRQSYEYIVKRGSILRIVEVAPRGTIKTGTIPTTAELYIKTSGGIENGKAKCSYMFNNMPIEFFETNAAEHSQEINVGSGAQSYDIKCKDSADDTAEVNINFTIEVDITAPKIARAYHEAEKLVIATDEDASCAYSTNLTSQCNFNFNNGTIMSSPEGTVHRTDWQADKTFYIKCKDIYENEPASAQCSIIVRTWEIAGGK